MIDKVSFKRIVARLDLKGPNLIKGIQMDGLRVIGSAREAASRYYREGVDEIVMLDSVASLYGREAMAGLIGEISSDCFVPLTVGGGINSLADADALFRAGADKVAINTGAIARPGLITEIAEKYGSQAVVVHVDARPTSPRVWQCYTEGGRQPSGLDVRDWMRQAGTYGAGEFFVTNIDRDGTRKGIDLDFVALCCEFSEVPVVASGGTQSPTDAVGVFLKTDAAGLAVGAGFHYGNFSPWELREEARAAAVKVRDVDA